MRICATTPPDFCWYLCPKNINIDIFKATNVLLLRRAAAARQGYKVSGWEESLGTSRLDLIMIQRAVMQLLYDYRCNFCFREISLTL